MRFDKIIFVFLLLFLFSCCSRPGADVRRISADINHLKEISIFDLFSRVKILPLETTDSSLIAHIDRIELGTERLYILDRKQHQIFIFDRKGKFLTKINRKGRGPGEYSLIYDLKLNPYTGDLEVLDPMGKLLLFSAQGDYQGEVRLPDELHSYHEFIPLNKDTIIFYSKNEKFTLNYYSRTSGKIFKQYFRGKRKLSINSPLVSFYRFCDSVYFTRYLYDEVYNISCPEPEVAYEWYFEGYDYIADEVVPEYDRNNIKEYFSVQELLPYVYINHLQNNRYVYACLAPESGKRYISVLYDKKKNEKWVFDKTKEEIIFSPYLLNDSLAIGILTPWRKVEEYINPLVLDAKDNEWLNKRSEEENPFLIQYLF